MLNCKSRIKRLLVNHRVLSLVQRLKSSRCILLRYHSVQDNPEQYAHAIGRGIIHSSAAFQQQMEWVARTYEPTTLHEIRTLAEHRRSLPRRGVIITFDDGYADNFTIALPILNRLGLKAAFYVTVDCIEPQRMPWFCRLRHAFALTDCETWTAAETGRVWQFRDASERRQAFLSCSGACARLAGAAQERLISRLERELAVEPLAPQERLMMTWDQIRELHRQGHIVGSHTLSHPNLAHLTIADVSREMCESKQRLEEQLAAPIVHFSYPSPILQPHWNEETVACCQAAGYQTAVTCTAGGVFPTDCRLALNRLYAQEDFDEFKWAVQCAFLGRYV
jgi:peptidoglycan/xylan/chitin deacetylase (PgdA/CDA1 family)